MAYEDSNKWLTHPPTLQGHQGLMPLSQSCHNTEFRQTVFPTAHSLYSTYCLLTFPGHQFLKYLKVKMSGSDITQTLSFISKPLLIFALKPVCW